MTQATLGFLLRVLAIAAVLIGLMNIFAGPYVTAHVFGGLLATVSSYEPSFEDLSSASVGSEMGFYAVFWIAYGGFAWTAARRVATDRRFVLMVIAVFLAGGLGRVVSVLRDGWPDPLFQVLMWIELVVPVLAASLLYARPGTNSARQS